MAMHTVKTNISVIEINNFKMFLEANEIKDVIVGIHQRRVSNFQLDNYIEYSYSDKEDGATIGLTYMKLRYNGLEEAFSDFLKNIDRIKSNSFGLGYINEYTDQ